jgi:hypothetical protein
MDLEGAEKGPLEYMSQDLLEIYYSKVKALLNHPISWQTSRDLNIVLIPCTARATPRAPHPFGHRDQTPACRPEQENRTGFPGHKAPTR